MAANRAYASSQHGADGQIGDIRHTDVRARVAKLSSETGATLTIRTYGVLAGILDDAVFDGRPSSNRAWMGLIGLPKKTGGRHGYLTHSEVIRDFSVAETEGFEPWRYGAGGGR